MFLVGGSMQKAVQCRIQVYWLAVRACGGREVGLRCLERPFGLCGLKDLWVRRAVHESQCCCGEAKMGFWAVGVQCVRCGGRGEGSGSVSESLMRGGSGRAGAPACVWVSRERQRE